MKTAIITGASGGIGSALVKKFVGEGYFVIGGYNGGKDRVDTLIRELGGCKDFFMPVFSDLSEKGGADELFSVATENFGHADVVVCSAGLDLYKLAEDTTESDLDKLYSVNVRSAYRLAALSLEKMLAREFGRIIFISSVWGVAGAAMESAYSMTKSSLTGLTRSLAKETGGNVTVNCICPGVIDTPMNSRFNKDEISDLIDRTPAGRLGHPEEVAELAAFLASDKAAFITGQSIVIDGGFIL